MDFDLEIISEEGDRPDPLFDSIMNAMNSMKEATADKIYQKIQKEGATNYSKPQVDRALASALKYGIFEVRNNRYRVRDDALDDEDTVYWKFQKKRDQTPFRIQEDVNEKHDGPKLDPEKDNQRFRRPITKLEECPHCGRTKRPEFEGKSKMKQMLNQKYSLRKKKTNKETERYEDGPKKRILHKRKDRIDKNDEEKSAKRRKPNFSKEDNDKMLDELTPEETSDSSDPDLEELAASEHTQYNKSYQEKKRNFYKYNKAPQSAFSSECITTDLDIMKTKASSISIKSEESDSEKTVGSSASDNQSQTRTTDGFFEQRPCTSQNTTGKVRNQYLHSGEMYRNQYEQTDMSKGNPDWLGYSDEPQGAIIQSNNVLTIEPMDSLAFKNPEQASYIS